MVDSPKLMRAQALQKFGLLANPLTGEPYVAWDPKASMSTPLNWERIVSNEDFYSHSYNTQSEIALAVSPKRYEVSANTLLWRGITGTSGLSAATMAGLAVYVHQYKRHDLPPLELSQLQAQAKATCQNARVTTTCEADAFKTLKDAHANHPAHDGSVQAGGAVLCLIFAAIGVKNLWLHNKTLKDLNDEQEIAVGNAKALARLYTEQRALAPA